MKKIMILILCIINSWMYNNDNYYMKIYSKFFFIIRELNTLARRGTEGEREREGEDGEMTAKIPRGPRARVFVVMAS